MKTLALFDFDGTITTQDTLLPFIRYACGPQRYWRGMAQMAPMLLRYKLGLLPNHEAKEQLLQHFFAGWDRDEFNMKAQHFAQRSLPRFIRPKAKEVLQWHREQRHRMLLVSASPENYLKPWASQYRLKVLATRLVVVDGEITGKLEGVNCWGPEKCSRIEAEVNLQEFDEIYAYGDSRGDKEMLALATKPLYRKL